MPMTFREARALFPAAQSFAWLNAAASSPIATPVANAMRAHLEETVQQGDLGWPKWQQFKEEVRARVAKFIGAGPQSLAFTASTSFGMHVVAQLLKVRGVSEVLTLESEFPSTTVPMLHDGLTLRVVRRRPEGTFPLSDLEAALRPTTKAVAVSAVQFASGFRVDLAGLSKVCNDRGLALIINAAQGVGHVPLDVTALNAAFLVGTSHKWLGAGYGTGLFYARPDWVEGVRLPLAGWLSVDPKDLWQTFPTSNRQDDGAGFVVSGARTRGDVSSLEGGGWSSLGLFAMGAILDVHEALGTEAVLAHDVKLGLMLRHGLRRRGFTPNTPDDAKTMSGICVVPVQGDAMDVVRGLLKDAKVATTARGGGVRLSTHFYNDESDVERALAAFDSLGVKPA